MDVGELQEKVTCICWERKGCREYIGCPVACLTFASLPVHCYQPPFWVQSDMPLKTWEYIWCTWDHELNYPEKERRASSVEPAWDYAVGIKHMDSWIQRIACWMQEILEWGLWLNFPGGAAIKNPPANAGGSGSIPGSGRSPGGGNGNPLQYSYLAHPHGPRSRAGGTPTVHGVVKSQIQLSMHSQQLLWLGGIKCPSVTILSHDVSMSQDWLRIGWLREPGFAARELTNVQ